MLILCILCFPLPLCATYGLLNVYGNKSCILLQKTLPLKFLKGLIITFVTVLHHFVTFCIMYALRLVWYCLGKTYNLVGPTQEEFC